MLAKIWLSISIPMMGFVIAPMKRAAYAMPNDVLQTLGYYIIGISQDPPASHRDFADRNELNFVLLSDESRQLLKAFGVWKPIVNPITQQYRTERSTFLVNERNVIENVWRRVSPADQHGQEVLEFVKERLVNKI